MKTNFYRKFLFDKNNVIYGSYNLYQTLDSGSDFTAIYLDISKYFDKIWHEGLLYKCRHEFGIIG